MQIQIQTLQHALQFKISRARLFAVMLCIGVVFSHAAAGKTLPEMQNISLDTLPVCYNFGCKQQSSIALPADEWATVAGWFVPPAETPAKEREQIRRAIGWMETIVGRHTPTHKDLAFDLPPGGDLKALFPGQLDCIDEAINTTTYLKLFAREKLLTHHVVIKPAYRRSWFDQHWAGQVREKKTGKRFVVDSWFQANGHLPVIQNSADWENITPITAVVDNSPDEVGAEVRRSRWHRFLRGERRANSRANAGE